MTTKTKPAKKAPRKSQRRRILVTPSPEAWLLVDEVHRLTKTPRAAIVAELIDVAAPSFQTVIEALRKIHEQPREAQRLLQNHANEQLAAMGQASLELDEKIGQLQMKIDAGMDGRTVQGQRAKRRGKPRADP